MSYELAIHPEAEREWAKLDGSIKKRFKDKFTKNRLIAPRVEKDTLRELPDCYKIKITTPQYRLVYHVNDETKTLTILIYCDARGCVQGIEDTVVSMGAKES